MRAFVKYRGKCSNINKKLVLITIHTLHGVMHRDADTSNGINVLKVGWGSNLIWLWDGYCKPILLIVFAWQE